MLHRATLADIDVMAAIHATSFSARDAWSRDVFDLQLGFPGVDGILHEAGGLLLLRIAADEAEILTIAVVPDKRRCGIGAELLTEAIELATSKRARAIFLEVSVDNIAALRLYQRAAFTEVGRRRRYYSDNSDAFVMRLALSGRDAE